MPTKKTKKPAPKKTAIKHIQKKSAAAERVQFNVRTTHEKLAAYKAAADRQQISLAFWIASHLDRAVESTP